MSDLTKLDDKKNYAVKHKPRSIWHYCTKLNMCRSTILLHRITDQMWHDHPFSQRNKATKKKRAVGLEVWEWSWKNFEKGMRQYRGFFIQQGVSVIFMRQELSYLIILFGKTWECCEPASRVKGKPPWSYS